jgi:hypothetical protein
LIAARPEQAVELNGEKQNNSLEIKNPDPREHKARTGTADTETFNISSKSSKQPEYKGPSYRSSEDSLPNIKISCARPPQVRTRQIAQ